MTKFAMFAETTCPLTLDHGSLRDLLRVHQLACRYDGEEQGDVMPAGNIEQRFLTAGAGNFDLADHVDIRGR